MRHVKYPASKREIYNRSNATHVLQYKHPQLSFRPRHELIHLLDFYYLLLLLATYQITLFAAFLSSLSSTSIPHSNSQSAMSASQAEQEAARQQEIAATASSRHQAALLRQYQINQQAGQKAERKNARVAAYVDLGHQLQGRQSEAQAQQDLLDSRDPRPEVTTTVDPELRGTGAGAGQQRRRDSEIQDGTPHVQLLAQLAHTPRLSNRRE